MSARGRPTATTAQNSGSAIAVERAIDVICVLAERGEAGVTEIAQEIGVSGGATHRLLVALHRKGVVDQDHKTGRYALGWLLLSLASGAKGKGNLRTLALPYMTGLRDLTGETSTLFVRSGFHRVCIEQVEGREEFHWRAELGKVFPLYAGASGKLLLAHMSDEERELYFESVELEPLTINTKTTRRELEAELVTIREQGWSIAYQDRSMSGGGAAAPIFHAHGELYAAITVAAPAWRTTPTAFASWIEPLTGVGFEISRLLGYKPD